MAVSVYSSNIGDLNTVNGDCIFKNGRGKTTYVVSRFKSLILKTQQLILLPHGGVYVDSNQKHEKENTYCMYHLLVS